MTHLAGIRTPRTGLRLDDPPYAVNLVMADVLATCARFDVAPIGTLTVAQAESFVDIDPLDKVAVRWDFETSEPIPGPERAGWGV